MSSQAGVLPPGVEAGSLGKRFVAYLIDGLVPGLLGAIVAGLVGAQVVTDPTVLLVLAIAVGVVGLGWLVLCWWMLATKGATPGMMIMKLQFVSLRNGKPVGWGSALLRQLVLGILVGTTVGAIVVLVTILTDVRNQGLHDKAGGGVVIKRRTRAARPTTSSVAVEAPVSQAPGGAAPVGLPAHLQPGAGFAPGGQDWSGSGFAPESVGSAPEFGAHGGFGQPAGYPPQHAQRAQQAQPGFPQTQPSAPPGDFPQSQSSAPGGQQWHEPAPPRAGSGTPPAGSGPFAQGPQDQFGQGSPEQFGPGQFGQGPQGQFGQQPAGGAEAAAPGGQPPPAQPWGTPPPPSVGGAPGGPITRVPFGSAEDLDRQPAAGQPGGPEPTVPIDLGAAGPPAFAAGPGGPPPTDERALYGRPPGEAVDEPDDGTRLVPRAGGRAPDQGWTIALDDGRYVKIESLVLIGRNPQPRPGEEHAELVKVGEAARTVSKTHLAVGVDNRGIYVSDRGSTNGSAIANANGEYEPCAPGEIVRVREGQIVSFGEHRLEVQRSFS